MVGSATVPGFLSFSLAFLCVTVVLLDLVSILLEPCTNLLGPCKILRGSSIIIIFLVNSILGLAECLLGRATHTLAVLSMIFNFVLGPPPPSGGSGGGFGLPFSEGNRRFLADSGPNPGILNFYFGPKNS